MKTNRPINKRRCKYAVRKRGQRSGLGYHQKRHTLSSWDTAAIRGAYPAENRVARPRPCVSHPPLPRRRRHKPVSSGDGGEQTVHPVDRRSLAYVLRCSKAQYQPGDHVYVSRWGQGVVRQRDGQRITVFAEQFGAGGATIHVSYERLTMQYPA